MTAALGIAVLIVLQRPRRLRLRRWRPRASSGDLMALATLVALGLDAGMTPAAAISWARPYAHPALAAAVTTLTRRAQLDGLAGGLRSVTGLGADLFAALARAVETGAALGPVLGAFQEQVQAEARAAAEARLRRLPVKLVFPLALLMLPGLVLIVSGPALIDLFGRLT